MVAIASLKLIVWRRNTGVMRSQHKIYYYGIKRSTANSNEGTTAEINIKR